MPRLQPTGEISQVEVIVGSSLSYKQAVTILGRQWDMWSVQKKPIFLFKTCIDKLKLNKTCLLQNTPFHHLYTASNVIYSSGTCFVGYNIGPVESFFLSLLSSENGNFQSGFQIWELKKSARAKYGEQGCWGMTDVTCFT
jgi:hypothetical protein